MFEKKSFIQATGHFHVIDRLALLNGVISGIALYPQVLKVFIDHTTAGVSMLSMFLIFLNSMIWVAYSVHRGLISIGISAILNVFAAGVLLLATMML